MDRKMKKQLMVLMGVAVLTASTSGLVAPVEAANVSQVVTNAVNGQGFISNNDAGVTEVSLGALVLNKWLNNLDIQTAAVSGKDYSEISSSLDNGETLLTASELAYTDLIAQLQARLAQDLKIEVRKGSLTEKEALELEQQASSSMNNLVSSPWNDIEHMAAIHNDGSDIIQYRITNSLSDTAILSEVGSSELRRSLRNGQSLLEASGLDSTTLIDYLTAKMNDDLETAVRKNKLSTDALIKAKHMGAEKIQTVVFTKGYEAKTTAWMEAFGQSIINKYVQTRVTYASNQTDKDYSDIVSGLEAGQSLAAASGLENSVLFTLLTDYIYTDLEAEWAAGSFSVELLEQLKLDAAKQVNESLGGQVAAGSSDKGIAQESVHSIITATAGYMSYTEDELREMLHQGKSLVEATGSDEAELINWLQWRSDSFIHQAVNKGWLKASDEQATKAEAQSLLKDAVNTRGYKAQVDANRYLEDRLDRILDDVADITDTKTNDLLRSLAQGQSLAKAANTDEDSLLFKLLSQTNQEINKLEAWGSIGEDEAVLLKTEYAAGIVKLLSVSE
ncbi:hypothetical protein D3C73_513980 [compost metagenome]